ncbi:MAG: hypothetical protein QOJ64_1256 [Acidobacteriota bacterium]|nr:hypothetical protein [Acidobacteriota bacterium]
MDLYYIQPIKTERCVHTVFICLVLILSCAADARGLAQLNQSVIPAPAQALLPIHLPDTSDLEQEVRAQLDSAQNALKAATKALGTPAEKLAEAYGTMGELYQAYSLLTPAMECYTNASRLAPKEFRWIYLLGKLYERQDEIQKAIGAYTRAVSLRADYLPLLVSLGNVYLQRNQLEEAEQFFNRAIEFDEASAAAQYGLGQVALSKRRYRDAIKYLERALTLAPEANRIHYALSIAYKGTGEIEKVQSQLVLSGSVGVRASDPFVDRLLDLVKGARLHLSRGRAALEAQRYSDAATEFRKAILEQRDSIPAHFNLGAALSQTGDLRGAISEFEETLRLDPNHTNAHYNLGLLLAQQDQHEGAIKQLRFVITASPGDSNARLLLAQELVKLHLPDQADVEFLTVLKAEPENESALVGHANILVGHRNYVEALSALNNAHARSPQNLLTTATLAFLLAASPQVELRDGKRALELARSVYEATAAINHGALVAMALAELGRCDEAAALISQLIMNASAVERADVIHKLQADRRRYETARPCRPMGDATISDQTRIR